MRGLRLGTLQYRIVPVLTGSALKNKGIQPMLDAVVDYLPSPLDVPPVIGEHPTTHAEVLRTVDDGEPFSALAFKIAADPFVGKLAFFRVYSGTLKSGSYILNSTKGRKERIGRILQMHANHREEIEEVHAGDIAAAVGLKETYTGDTLADPDHPVILESMTFPEPVIEVKIEPKTKADQDKMGLALQRLAEEDPTFRVKTDEESGETLIAGMGELHLDVLVDRMIREFKVAANIGKPQVSYRETIRRRGRGQRPLRAPDRRQGPVRPRRSCSSSRSRRGPGTSSSTRRSAARSPGSTCARSTTGSGRRSRRASTPGTRWSTSAPRLRRVVPRGRLERDGVQDRRLDGGQGRGGEGRARRSSSR